MRPVVSALLLVLAACTGGSVAMPDGSTTDTLGTQGTDPPDSGSGPVETGWPIASGEGLALVDSDARTVGLHYNAEQFLSPAADTTWTIPAGNATVLLCDLDGDELDDAWVLTGGSSDLQIAVYKNQGGTFASSASYTVTPGFTAQNFSYACGDFRGTGRADLFAFKKEVTKLFFYPNTGGALDVSGEVKTATSLSGNTRWIVDDYDGDGRDELGALAGGTLSVYRVSDGGAPDLSSALLSATVASGYDVTTLDLNADERADLALWNGAAFIVALGDGQSFDQSSPEAFTISGSGEPQGARLR